jgi:hypothetical protein
MNFLNKSLDKLLADAIADLAKRSAEHAEAERLAIAKRDARDALADDGNTGDELRKAVDAHLKARAYAETLDGALAKKRTQVATLQAEVAKIADDKLRAKTAQTIEALADAISKSSPAVTSVLSESSGLYGRAALLMHGAGSLEINEASLKTLQTTFASLAGELAAICDSVVRHMHDHAAAILSGAAPAAMPQPALQLVAPQRRKTVQVTALKPVAYIWRGTLDEEIATQGRLTDGMVETAGIGETIDLDSLVAKNAIAIGACCAVDDLRRRRAAVTQGHNADYPGKPQRSRCVALEPLPPDTESKVLRSPQVVGPPLQVIDRGPPVQMSVARNNLDHITRGKDDKS